MKRPRSYLFTARHQSTGALIAVSLGLISVISTGFVIYKTYEDGGSAGPRSAAVVLLCLIFALTGLILAILSRREPDTLYFFSYLGMILNAVVIAACFIIMYLGLA